MKRMKRWITTGLVLAALLAPRAARAYFELDLANGGRMLADSYREDGSDLLLFRGSGTLRVKRSDVTSIREHEGKLGETAASPSAPAPSAPAPAAPAAPVTRAAPAPEPPPAEAPPSASASTPRDLHERESALTQRLILGYRERLFAQNRGDDPKKIRTMEKELERVKDEREDVRKQLR